MRICDKCKKELRKGDGNAHIDLGYPFIYDLCAECGRKFFLHVDSFFNTKKSDKENV